MFDTRDGSVGLVSMLAVRTLSLFRALCPPPLSGGGEGAPQYSLQILRRANSRSETVRIMAEIDTKFSGRFLKLYHSQALFYTEVKYFLQMSNKRTFL
jgi:hypothetical protein